MSEISSYEAQVKKMQGLCEEHNLVYRFKKDRYPMTFTIKLSHAVDAQMSMLESVEDEGYISPKASMTWIFNDGVLETKVHGGTFTISKTCARNRKHPDQDDHLLAAVFFPQRRRGAAVARKENAGD